MRRITYNPRYWYNPNVAHAYWYARNIKKGRWHEAEIIIQECCSISRFVI